MKKHFCDSLIVILKEMCKRVNCKYDNIDFNSNDWFMEYSWREQEQKDFEKWLAEYFYNNKKAREEMLYVSWKNKKHCKEAAKMFVFNYGWKFEK